MKPGRHLAANTASALVGAIVGALLVLGADSLTREPSQRAPEPLDSPADVEVVDPGPLERSGRLLLAWSPRDGLPRTTERILESMPQVRRSTTILASLDWISKTRSGEGAVLDDPRKGRRIPVEIAAIRPADYAPFVSAGDRSAIASLGPGEALMARTEAAIRGDGAGLDVWLADGRVRVVGVVGDDTTSGYELMVAGGPRPSWQRVDPFFLVELKKPAARAKVSGKIRSLLAPGHVVRIRAEGETPYMRYGDSVLPQMLIKEAFGEFAATPQSNGGIDIEPRWKERNIVSEAIPVLGSVTCHKALFPQLRSAMKEIVSRGLEGLIDPGQYAGCFSPRFIDANPAGRISHHSWGIAFDINSLENAFGTRADLDRRLVDVFESWGFTWGGRWLIPDGMHFEWVRFP